MLWLIKNDKIKVKVKYITPAFLLEFEYIIKTITDPKNMEVLLFQYLFSGLIKIVQQSGGIKAFAAKAEERISSKKGVFYTLWALIPLTFIDCGFTIVAAGSIIKPLSAAISIQLKYFSCSYTNL